MFKGTPLYSSVIYAMQVYLADYDIYMNDVGEFNTKDPLTGEFMAISNDQMKTLFVEDKDKLCFGYLPDELVRMHVELLIAFNFDAIKKGNGQRLVGYVPDGIPQIEI